MLETPKELRKKKSLIQFYLFLKSYFTPMFLSFTMQLTAFAKGNKKIHKGKDSFTIIIYLCYGTALVNSLFSD